MGRFGMSIGSTNASSSEFLVHDDDSTTEIGNNNALDESNKHTLDELFASGTEGSGSAILHMHKAIYLTFV